MSARDMSISEALAATAAWAPTAAGGPPSPTRDFLQRAASSAEMLPDIDAARATLALAPADGSEAARLTDQLDAADTSHDNRIRFIISNLESYTFSTDAALVERVKYLVLTVFPEGKGLTNASYGAEGGAGLERATLLTPDLRAQLAGFPLAVSTGAPRSIADELDLLQADAATLRDLFARRATLSSDGTMPTAQETLDARRQLVRLVEHVLGNFAELDRLGRLDATSQIKAKALRDTWSHAVSAATTNAAARRRVAAPAPTPGPTPAAGTGPA